jgi:hypothetical protein
MADKRSRHFQRPFSWELDPDKALIVTSELPECQYWSSTQTPGGIRPCFEVPPTRRPDGTFGIVYLDTLDELGFFIELVETPSAERVIATVAFSPPVGD